jgi:hypothetical protein
VITQESNSAADVLLYDLAIVAVGYERRCRFVVEQSGVSATYKVGLDFGFLQVESYSENRSFFERYGCEILDARDSAAFDRVSAMIRQCGTRDDGQPIRIFVDISSMSRDMMSNVALSIGVAMAERSIQVVAAYAPAKFSGKYEAAPIRLASPVRRELAGWSPRPDKPLGVIMGLGCEPGLALGSLQVLEPLKAWLYSPRGFDSRFEQELKEANEHVSEIFDVTEFDYDLSDPTITRGRIEALLNSVESSFRLVAVPFGPKLYAWLILATVIFGARRSIGVWSFSSREEVAVVDREASGKIIWYNSHLEMPTQAQRKSD